MWEAKTRFFLGLVIKALLQKMPPDLGCCLQGNPKTEVTGSVAGSKETDKTRETKTTYTMQQPLTQQGPTREQSWVRRQVTRTTAPKQRSTEQRHPRWWGLKWLQKPTPSRTQRADLKALSEARPPKPQSAPTRLRGWPSHASLGLKKAPI